MRYICALKYVPLLLALVYTQDAPISCFETGSVRYGNDEEGLIFRNDLDLIETITKDHVLTAVTSCYTNERIEGL